MARLPKAQLTHVGIFVWDLDKMVDFYEREFGLVVNDRGVSSSGLAAAFMSGDPSEHHQLVLVAARAPDQMPTLNQISFEVKSLEDVRRYWRHFTDTGVTILQTKNHGNAWSVYVSDPEGNRLEIYAHSQWYMEQPIGAPVDYSKSLEELMSETETLVRSSKNFTTREAWMAKVQAELEQISRG